MNNKYLSLLHNNISHKPSTIVLKEKDENIDMAVEISIDLETESLLFNKFDEGYVNLLREEKKCDYVLFLEFPNSFKIFLIELKNKINTNTLKKKVKQQISNGYIISTILKDHFNDEFKSVEMHAVCVFNEDQIEESLLSEKIEISDEITKIELDSVAVDWLSNRLIMHNNEQIPLLKIDSKNAVSSNPLKLNLSSIVKV